MQQSLSLTFLDSLILLHTSKNNEQCNHHECDCYSVLFETYKFFETNLLFALPKIIQVRYHTSYVVIITWVC